MSRLICIALLTAAVMPPIRADRPGDEEKSSTAAPFNLPLKTLGGTQFWTDVAYRDGFRIQANALTGHHRLLDRDDVRRAWGTLSQCTGQLDHLAPPSPSSTPRRVAVLLHGLMRTSASMKPLENELRAGPFDDVMRFSYASTRASMDDHAVALRRVLEGQPASTHFGLVGHSMGNIVVRRLIGELNRDGDPAGLLPRLDAMVMLGPPNKGAAIARRLAPTQLYGWITGRGGLELGPRWKSFESKLGIPEFPFLIIAGDVSDNPVQNPLVDGSSDFVVSLDEAKLAGAAGVVTLPVWHSFLMNDPAAMRITAEFFRGVFADE